MRVLPEVHAEGGYAEPTPHEVSHKVQQRRVHVLSSVPGSALSRPANLLLCAEGSDYFLFLIMGVGGVVSREALSPPVEPLTLLVAVGHGTTASGVRLGLPAKQGFLFFTIISYSSILVLLEQLASRPSCCHGHGVARQGFSLAPDKYLRCFCRLAPFS